MSEPRIETKYVNGELVDARVSVAFEVDGWEAEASASRLGLIELRYGPYYHHSRHLPSGEGLAA